MIPNLIAMLQDKDLSKPTYFGNFKLREKWEKGRKKEGGELCACEGFPTAVSKLVISALFGLKLSWTFAVVLLFLLLLLLLL